MKKQMLASDNWRLAFSRPGLLTLKYVGSAKTAPRLGSPLVRLSGTGLGPVRGELAEECFQKLWQLAFEPSQPAESQPDQGQSGSAPLDSAQPDQAEPAQTQSEQVEPAQSQSWDAIHVFQRDRALPGAFRFEPGPNELSSSIAEALRAWLAQRGVNIPVNQVAQPGLRVLDVILVEPNQWFIGHHTVEAVHEQWPGGVPVIVPPAEMISRAYLKMAEALLWSRLPIGSGDAVVEVGSAPGGASQRLLDMGLAVTGVDAAEMDERIAEHPRFEHWRSKAAAVKRKLYRKFKWLVCDANVAPNYTLDVVEDIASFDGNQIEGMVLTFKLSDWEQLDHLQEQLDRIKHLGFSRVEARQLAHNRRELCVVAQR
ncbi:MAG: SAM-dependent methyltransferase [Aureliella sp.]